MATMEARQGAAGAIIVDWTGLVPNDPAVPRFELGRAMGLVGAVEAAGGYGGTIGLRKGNGTNLAGAAVKDVTSQADVALASGDLAEISTAALYLWPTPPASGSATVRLVLQRGE